MWQNMANGTAAVLSDVTAEKEYGRTRDFIVKGIRSGKLEYREGSVCGNPYPRMLRNQLETYITARRASEYLGTRKVQTSGAETARKFERRTGSAKPRPAFANSREGAVSESGLPAPDAVGAS